MKEGRTTLVLGKDDKMIRRTYEFKPSDTLEHSGRKGMQWYKHIYGEVQEQAKYFKPGMKDTSDKSKYEGYKVSDKTKKLAAGDSGSKKKNETKTETEDETKTTTAGSSGTTDKKETTEEKKEKTEVEKLQEQIDKLKEQLANAKSSGGSGGRSSGGSGGSRNTSNKNAVDTVSKGEGISGDKAKKSKAKSKLEAGIGGLTKEKDSKLEAGIGLVNEAKAKKTIKATENKINEIKEKIKKEEPFKVEPESLEEAAARLKDYSISGESNNDKSASKAEQEKVKKELKEDKERFEKLLNETIDRTSSLEEQLKKSEERLNAYEELLKKYVK